MKKHLITTLSIISVITIFITSVNPLESIESKPSQYVQAISVFDEYVKLQMQMDNIPGLTIGFRKDDFIWTRGYGYSDLENMVTAKSESAYRLASITKTITAIAVMQLVEAGRIDLEAEVQTYVPYFPRKQWPVTIRLLLGHLGGISHYRDYSREGHFKYPMNTQQALSVFKDFELIARPGTRYNYSSYGFNLLGAVIEGASGKSYGEYIKQHIFKPRDMQDSRLDHPLIIIRNRVRGYRLLGKTLINSEFIDISSRFAGGGTRSTVVDLLKYSRGIYEGKLLQPESWKTMFTSMATTSRYFTGYGMGWTVRPWKGHFQVSHGGSQAETKTYLLIFPTEKFAVAIAAKLEGADLMPYVKRLAGLVLDEDLDSSAYLPDKAERIIFKACSDIFSYGLSRYAYFGKSINENESDVKQAFIFFNNYTDTNLIKKDAEKNRNMLNAGIHPAFDKTDILFPLSKVILEFAIGSDSEIGNRCAISSSADNRILNQITDNYNIVDVWHFQVSHNLLHCLFI